MGKYQAYPEYKDSRIGWMGHIPKDWLTVPVGRLFSRTKRTGHSEKELLSVYRDYGVIPKSSRDDNNNKESDDLTPYQLVQPNDLVMNKMKAWQGSIAISEFEGIVSPAYFVYEPRNILFDLAHPRYIHYLLRNPIYITQYMSRSKGIRVNQWDLDPDEFKTIELLLPSKNEQSKIFNFLDHETAKIDVLIEKQQQLISLLQEKRQAVISHAVSIKSGEKSAKLSYFIDLLSGFAFPSSGFKQEPNNAIPLLRGINVGVDHIKWSENVYWPSSDVPKLKEFELAEGDIVFGMDRPWISSGARVAEIKNSDLPCLLLQRVARIRSLEGTYQPFVKLCLSSHEFKHFIEADLTGVSVPHISPDQIKSFPIRAIGFEKQKHLTDLALAQCKKLNEIENQAKKAIDLMQERRTALISAAVTGKIDVRNWQAPSQSSTTSTEEQAL